MTHEKLIEEIKKEIEIRIKNGERFETFKDPEAWENALKYFSMFLGSCARISDHPKLKWDESRGSSCEKWRGSDYCYPDPVVYSYKLDIHRTFPELRKPYKAVILGEEMKMKGIRCRTKEEFVAISTAILQVYEGTYVAICPPRFIKIIIPPPSPPKVLRVIKGPHRRKGGMNNCDIWGIGPGGSIIKANRDTAEGKNWRADGVREFDITDIDTDSEILVMQWECKRLKYIEDSKFHILQMPKSGPTQDQLKRVAEIEKEIGVAKGSFFLCGGTKKEEKKNNTKEEGSSKEEDSLKLLQNGQKISLSF
ncbi:MAG: hypothetical protein WC788_05305 [Candidatus Paceibacterota bacterium]|jgi:hypothetical protein